MKKARLIYTGTAPGQADSIERFGFVFVRGTDTEVSSEVFEALKNEPGFAPFGTKSKIPETPGGKE